jgi:hypothetical protein
VAGEQWPGWAQRFREPEVAWRSSPPDRNQPGAALGEKGLTYERETRRPARSLLTPVEQSRELRPAKNPQRNAAFGPAQNGMQGLEIAVLMWDVTMYFFCPASKSVPSLSNC